MLLIIQGQPFFWGNYTIFNKRKHLYAVLIFNF